MWIIWYFLLVVVSALFEGVLAAIMRLDKYELARRARLGSERAQAISPLRQRGRELALLFMLGSVLSGFGALAAATTHMQLWSALLLTTLLVVFSRLIARSALQGKGYKIARSSASQLLRVLDITSPVVTPLSGVLMKPSPRKSVDFYSKQELIEILDEHKEGPDTNLKQTDVDVARSSLQFSDKVARQIMTARDAIKSVKPSDKLSLGLLDELHASGYAFFPVSRGNAFEEVSGILSLAKVVGSKQHNQQVTDTDLLDVLYVSTDTPLLEVLTMIRNSDSNLVLVIDDENNVQGLVTLDDILSELFGASLTTTG